MSKYKILEIDPFLKPYSTDIELRMDNYWRIKRRLLAEGETISSFANGHLYYGFHRENNGWVFREWAPNAESISIFGEFNNWDRTSHKLNKLQNGNWEIFIEGKDTLHNNSPVKLEITAFGHRFDRLPLYSKRVAIDLQGSANAYITEDNFVWTDKDFVPSKNLLIYESHVGMATEEYKIGSYSEFRLNVLPHIKACGYNTIQLMAIMEHPYYASFGYQVGNFFAVSSRFGSASDLKELINTAHSMGIAVLLDLVHSHATKNTLDGINEFDGTDYQFFHRGEKGNHPAWDTKLFNYGKDEVLHFLLSNLKYWLTEYHFDGFRFDGVTSMLYLHHGLGDNFDNYRKYFDISTDIEAVAYLQLANELIHEINPLAITIAEDMSGMPGMCIPIKDGGIGFDYRLSMGVPDFWVNTLKTSSDEELDMYKMWHELTTRRPQEKNVGYCESHDQALVGDKTIIFWLADAEMYDKMSIQTQSYKIDRAIALHKLIRLVTFSLAGEGYMNFMGNEFGHPEWIDFPREGNNDSYHYARRQWSLAYNEHLKYKYLLNFDKAMLQLNKSLFGGELKQLWIDQSDKLLCFQKGIYIFAFNFHTTYTHSRTVYYDHKFPVRIVLDTDNSLFGGFERGNCANITEHGLEFTLSPRTAIVLAISK